jgi:hypothetical protein
VQFLHIAPILLYYPIEPLAAKSHKSNNSLEASQSSSATNSHSGSNSSRHNQNKGNRNNGNSGSLSPPNQLPPPPPINSSGASNKNYLAQDIHHQSPTATASYKFSILSDDSYRSPTTSHRSSFLMLFLKHFFCYYFQSWKHKTNGWEHNYGCEVI